MKVPAKIHLQNISKYGILNKINCEGDPFLEKIF